MDINRSVQAKLNSEFTLRASSATRRKDGKLWFVPDPKDERLYSKFYLIYAGAPMVYLRK
jgi:hypothetical protein